MTANTKSDTDRGTGRSVEDEWVSLLENRGLERWQAERIIVDFQLHPRLRMGTPTEEEVEAHVSRVIKEHGLGDYEAIDDEDDVVEALLETLNEGLSGELEGPGSYRPDAMVDVSGLVEESPTKTETMTFDMPTESVGASEGSAEGAAGFPGDIEGDQGQPSSSAHDSPSNSSSEGYPQDSSTTDQAEAEAGVEEQPLEDYERQLLSEVLAEPPSNEEDQEGPESLGDVAVMLALNQNNDQLDRFLDDEQNDPKQIALWFAKQAVSRHRGLLRQTLFPSHSPAEQEIFYRNLIDEHGLWLLRNLEEEDGGG